MATDAARVQRCPTCGRLLGYSRVPTNHPNCPAQHETKCGKCGGLVALSMDPQIPARTV